MLKVLETLLDRAERKAVKDEYGMGSAVKRTRNVYGHEVEPTEQYRVIVKYTEEGRYRNIIVDHYGTEIAHIIYDKREGSVRLHNWYGESKSDRDALNGLMEYFGLPCRFRYFPSTDEFIMEGRKEVSV